jgi:hypothetical protein
MALNKSMAMGAACCAAAGDRAAFRALDRHGGGDSPLIKRRRIRRGIPGVRNAVD